MLNGSLPRASQAAAELQKLSNNIRPGNAGPSVRKAIDIARQAPNIFPDKTPKLEEAAKHFDNAEASLSTFYSMLLNSASLLRKEGAPAIAPEPPERLLGELKNAVVNSQQFQVIFANSIVAALDSKNSAAGESAFPSYSIAIGKDDGVLEVARLILQTDSDYGQTHAGKIIPASTKTALSYALFGVLEARISKLRLEVKSAIGKIKEVLEDIAFDLRRTGACEHSIGL